MLPILEGVIARRVLLNFRVDPNVARRLLPKPLELTIHNGFAVVGICLIRLEQLRPKGFPSPVGMSSENMAHRIAIRYPTGEGRKDGVFIWRRDTDQKLVTLLGGRLFPGVHQLAEFHVMEGEDKLIMDVRTRQGDADVSFEAASTAEWKSTTVFKTFEEVCSFFARGDCGFSCALHEGKLEGMQLRTLKWEMNPLRVDKVRAAFYDNHERFPPESIEFDCALLMRGIPHEWHELSDIPELAGTIRGETR